MPHSTPRDPQPTATSRSGVHPTSAAERMLELHYRLADALASTRGLHATLEKIVAAVLGVDGIDVVGVYLRDAGTGDLALVGHAGAPPELLARAAKLPGGSPQARVVTEGRSVFRDHAELALEIGAELPERELLRAVGVVPIRCEGAILGALNVGSRVIDEIAPATRDALVVLAEQIGGALGRVLAEERAEQRRENLEAFLDRTDDLFFICDEGGRILVANRAVERATGRPSRALCGAPIASVHPPALAGEVGALIDEAVARGSSSGALALVGPGDARVLVEARLARGAWDGRPAVFVTGRDVTELRAVEERLRQAHKLEVLGTLAGGVAHDFNNVLAVITGYAELALAAAVDGESPREDLQEILAAATRGRDLVQRILRFARKGKAELVRVDLNAEVRDVARMLERTLPGIVRVELELCDEPVVVDAEPSQLGTVLLNLATNARDAMPRGGALCFRTEAIGRALLREGDVEAVRLTVRDTGSGMDPATVSRIFDPFYTTKDVGRGVGLGLALVKDIVRAHKGLIRCTSAVGVGTSFVIELPTAAGAL